MQTIKDAANAVSEKVKEVVNGIAHDPNKETAKIDNNSTGDRASHITDKEDAGGHETNKEIHKTTSDERGVISQIGDTISNAYHYVAEKVHEVASAASHEIHKDKVKESDNTSAEKTGEKHHETNLETN